MKRQQAISRFFAPKMASSSGTPSNSTPSTSSHSNRRPLETPPSVIVSPRALAPGGASKSIVQGFAFSPAAKKRRASEEEETEPSQDVLGSGEGRDGSLRVAPLRKKHTSWKNTTPVHASELPKNEDLKDQQSGNWTAPPELFEPPGSCETGSDSGEIGDDSLRQLKMHSDDPEGESFGFLEGLEESPVEIEAPKLQKRKLSRLKENTVFPESDPVRHQRFVEKLVAQSDQNRGLQES